MRVISLRPLRDFWERHADAEAPLRHWYKLAVHAEWSSLQDARKDFPHADGVENNLGETLTFFNIAGNNYRLIARVRYDYKLMNIRALLTHAEYDKGKWKN